MVGIAHPMGMPMGRPGDADTQRAVLRAALEAAAAMPGPRTCTELAFTWPERRSVAMREPDPPPPIVELLTRKPWLLPRLASGHIPAHRPEVRS